MIIHMAFNVKMLKTTGMYQYALNNFKGHSMKTMTYAHMRYNTKAK